MDGRWPPERRLARRARDARKSLVDVAILDAGALLAMAALGSIMVALGWSGSLCLP